MAGRDLPERSPVRSTPSPATAVGGTRAGSAGRAAPGPGGQRGRGAGRGGRGARKPGCAGGVPVPGAASGAAAGVHRVDGCGRVHRAGDGGSGGLSAGYGAGPGAPRPAQAGPVAGRGGGESWTAMTGGSRPSWPGTLVQRTRCGGMSPCWSASGAGGRCARTGLDDRVRLAVELAAAGATSGRQPRRAVRLRWRRLAAAGVLALGLVIAVAVLLLPGGGAGMPAPVAAVARYAELLPLPPVQPGPGPGRPVAPVE